MDPELRVMRAKIAAHERWANEPNRAKATEPARKGLLERFAREVDPDGALDPVELAKRVESARKAFYLRLSLKSAQARRARSQAAELEAQIEADLRDAIV